MDYLKIYTFDLSLDILYNHLHNHHASPTDDILKKNRHIGKKPAYMTRLDSMGRFVLSFWGKLC